MRYLAPAGMAIEISMAIRVVEGTSSCVESKKVTPDYVSLCSVSVIIVGLHVLEVWGKRDSRRRQRGYI